MMPKIKKLPLGDVATFKSGGTPNKSKADYWDGHFPWVSAKDLKTPIITDSIDRLTKKGFEAANVAPENSLLILVRGMTLFKDVPVCLAGRAVAFNQDIKALLVSEELTPQYLMFYLQSQKNKLLDLVDSAGHGTGRLNTVSLKAFPVLVPSLPEQHAIAVLLSTWNLAIEKAERLIAAKEKLYIFLLSRLISNSSFSHVHIRDFTAEVSRRNVGVLIDRVLSVTNRNGFILPEDQFARRVASSDLSNYKIVTSGQYAYNPSRINVGSIARLDNWDTGVLSPMYVVFKLDETRANSDFFLHWLESHEAKQRISKSAQGSVRETVSFGDLGAIPFPLPSIEEQKQIAAILTTARQEIDLLKKQAAAYRRQKRGLMQRLLTGEWRVRVG
jgi:type I restriction enzyme S subunit